MYHQGRLEFVCDDYSAKTISYVADSFIVPKTAARAKKEYFLFACILKPIEIFSSIFRQSILYALGGVEKFLSHCVR